MEAVAVQCPFCGGEEVARKVEGTERFFGTGGSFDYSVCAACGSIYLDDAGIDLAPHYPEHYYSYTGAKRPPLQTAVEDFVVRQRARFVLRLLRKAGTRVDAEARIVDVGSGAGDLLRGFAAIGYRNVLGVDPFLREGVETGGVAVERRPLKDVANDVRFAGTAATVMFHHSLEHVFDPAEQLVAAARLLRPGGGIVVRVPVVSYAWERYGTYWVGFDAPRHVALPTERGMVELAKRLGLKIAAVRYDSTENQFVVSNAYVAGRTQLEAFPSCPPRTALRKLVTIPLRLRAAWLNAQKRGDQAAFVLLPASEGIKVEP
ncbi:MAG: methyltransferase domain-containing protein [Candidatus Eremiobacteraeota bacterium]|nr:methyltransferase domain-containing protein [Candidatus Eremiobacteraeota bacterium]